MSETALSALLLELPPLERPSALWGWWSSERIDVEQLGAMLIDAWTAPSSPCSLLEEVNWIALFRAAGFIAEVDTSVSIPFRLPPIEPVTLWRGAPTEGSGPNGMSWSFDVGTARTFFAKWRFSGESALYQATVPANFILAVYATPFEQEVVIDPSGVKEVEVVERGPKVVEDHPLFGRH